MRYFTLLIGLVGLVAGLWLTFGLFFCVGLPLTLGFAGLLFALFMDNRPKNPRA